MPNNTAEPWESIVMNMLMSAHSNTNKSVSSTNNPSSNKNSLENLKNKKNKLNKERAKTISLIKKSIKKDKKKRNSAKNTGDRIDDRTIFEKIRSLLQTRRNVSNKRRKTKWNIFKQKDNVNKVWNKKKKNNRIFKNNNTFQE